ncbi:E3 SUMO-protein ligase ZNF451-like isoform X2 [Lingula anatina]|uniref:E3 SUMO-protein ligase ZNF451-like isoform X2 n=1 Tax=Lingula anatina TaxID=7574 RepID=A0A2R2MJF4_LINAN|nr:E3 SUMO-protein ligase ZNF451-like isoform X2 [Lingula anatina]|eukprot:XP_023930351.1 E3 SUMO-protein ligase ZNF451-like isoform X2 [Lingula anatina]
MSLQQLPTQWLYQCTQMRHLQGFLKREQRGSWIMRKRTKKVAKILHTVAKKASPSECKRATIAESRATTACSTVIQSSESNPNDEDKEVAQLTAKTPSVSKSQSLTDTLGLPKGFSVRDFSPNSQELLQKKLENVQKCKVQQSDFFRPCTSLFVPDTDSSASGVSNSSCRTTSHSSATLVKKSNSKGRQGAQKPVTSINTIVSNPGSPKGVPLADEDPDPNYLSSMHQIVFLDLDNWPALFKKLPAPLPDRVFVWAFIGGKTVWKPPHRLERWMLYFPNISHSQCCLEIRGSVNWKDSWPDQRGEQWS